MARIPRLNDYNDEKRAVSDGDVIKVLNKDGDTMLFTTFEAKDILKTYMTNELSMFSIQQTQAHKVDLTHKFNAAFEMFNDEMDKLINERINEVSEKVIHQLVDYKIEEEVKKRVEAKLNKIRKEL
jgi:peroxiredoxin family protein